MATDIKLQSNTVVVEGANTFAIVDASSNNKMVLQANGDAAFSGPNLNVDGGTSGSGTIAASTIEAISMQSEHLEATYTLTTGDITGKSMELVDGTNGPHIVQNMVGTSGNLEVKDPELKWYVVARANCLAIFSDQTISGFQVPTIVLDGENGDIYLKGSINDSQSDNDMQTIANQLGLI